MNSIRDRIHQQPFYQEYPYKVKLSFATLRGITPSLIENTSSSWRLIHPSFLFVQRWAHANMKDNKPSYFHSDHPDDDRAKTDLVHDDNYYYRRVTAEHLRDQYRTWGFPDATWTNLELQETMLAEHRKYEFHVSKAGELLFTVRLQVGTHWQMIPEETKPYDGGVPFVEFYAVDGPFFYRKRVPTFFLPADLIQRDPYSPHNPLNYVRQVYDHHGIVEIGRAWFNPQADKDDLANAKKLGFSMLADLLPELAPQKDLQRLIVVMTGGPSGQRLYTRQFGVEPYADLTELLGPFLPGKLYDVLGRTAELPVNDAGLEPSYRIENAIPVRAPRPHAPEQPGIHLLLGTGDSVYQALKSSELIAEGMNLDDLLPVEGSLSSDIFQDVQYHPDDKGWFFR